MRWRWLIRSLLLLPVLLCLFCGVWSWWYKDTLLFECGSTNWDIESCVGSLRFTVEGGYPPRTEFNSYWWRHDTDIWDRRIVLMGHYEDPTCFRRFACGFGYGRSNVSSTFGYSPVGDSWVCLPHWFFLLISSLLLILAWRRTRPKPIGFPVEVPAGTEALKPPNP